MFFACSKYNCPACLSWHYLPAMATIVPVAATFFTVFIIASDASKCTHSNIEILSHFIDARINATVNARVTAALLEKKFDTAVDERVAAIVNTTVSALTTSVDEQITEVSTTVNAINVEAARFTSQPGEVVLCIMYLSHNP